MQVFFIYNCNTDFPGLTAGTSNPLTETDHAFRIVDQGKIPDGKGGFRPKGVTGRAEPGENFAYFSQHILERKGTGKTYKGLGALERTGPTK